MLLLALAVAAAPIDSTPYWACLRTATLLAEKSGERPRDIADAAVVACVEDEPPEYGPRLMMKIREGIKPRLVAIVVAERAKRKR